MSEKNILAISYAKRVLDPESREYKRMQAYAEQLTSYHIIVFTKGNAGFASEIHDGLLHVYATNVRTKVGMLWRAYKIGQSILKQHHNKQFVVSSQDPFESSMVGRALARTRNATHHIQIHGDVFNPASSNTSVLQRIRAVYGRYVVRRTASIRVVSTRIKHSLVRLGVDAACVTVLPVQANLSALLQIGLTKKHIEKQVLQIVYIGRFASEKQIHILLQAAKILTEQGVAFNLKLIGSGPCEASLHTLSSSLQLETCIQFVPWTNDIASELADADVFCLASAHEGWGMVLLEAAAARLAIVTTDVGCVGERLMPESSVLVAASAKDFADQLSRLQSVDLRTKLSTNAYREAADFNLDPQEYIQQWVTGYFKS